MMKSSMMKSGFTLIELLVALSILVVILMMGAAFANFSVGRLRSAQNVKVNEAIRNAFDLIGQKMNTANAKLGTVYGFNENGGILEIVNKSDTGATTCTTIGLSAGVLKMKQDTTDCSNTLIDSTWQAITPDTIEVTAFTPTMINAMINSDQTVIPTAQIIITAREKGNPDNQITIQTSYYLDYQTVNNLK